MVKTTNSILDKTFRYSLKLAKQYYFKQLAKQEIVCPTFGTESVSVTREGWEHLAHAKRKSKLDVFGRFFVLELVRQLLESAQQATYYRKTDSIEYWGLKAWLTIKALSPACQHSARGGLPSSSADEWIRLNAQLLYYH